MPDNKQGNGSSKKDHNSASMHPNLASNVKPRNPIKSSHVDTVSMSQSEGNFKVSSPLSDGMKP